MNEQQLQQLVTQVADALANGANPEEIAQQLQHPGAPVEVIQQIMQAAMAMAKQGNGKEDGMNGGMSNNREAQQLIETAIGEIGAEPMLAILMAFMQLDDANKQALLQQLQQMSSQQGPTQTGKPTEPTQGSTGQEQQAQALQENLFGGR